MPHAPTRRRMHSFYFYYPMCLLFALASHIAIARAKIPIRDNGLSSNGASVPRQFQFTKIASAKHKEAASSSNPDKNGSERSPSHRVPFTAASKTDASDEESETSRLAQPHSHPSSVSIGVGSKTGGTLTLIKYIFSNSAGPILRSLAFGAQMAIACYLAKASWTVMKDVWEEVNQDFASARGGRDTGGDVREEQDMPFADEGAISCGLADEIREDDKEDDDLPPRPRQRRQSQNDGESTPQAMATKELAARLNYTGIPYASSVSAESPTRSVEQIVRSLTRSEGNVLMQTLLTPFDGALFVEGNNMESPAAAAAAWNAIGGLSEAKESLLDLAFPLLPAQSDSDKNNYYGGLLANPPGVLLYGPPGCGKTMLVRALAATVGARFLAVSPSCLLRKYVGDTNLNVRALFSVARKISPCVIFVDELDGLFRERGGEDHDVGRDLKTEFLQLWDGIRNHAQGGNSILVIGATNRPFDVDPAFLRRMPRRVFVGLPDYDSRVSVLQNILSHVPLDLDFNLGLVASKTDGYSPSDIREVLQAAALYPLREARAQAISMSQMDSMDGEKDIGMSIRVQMPTLRNLRTEDVLRALEVTKPTHLSRKYQRELMNYVQNSGGSWTSSVSKKDTDDNYFIADAGTFSHDFLGQENVDDSDSYSYDDDSSDSEQLL